MTEKIELDLEGEFADFNSLLPEMPPEAKLFAETCFLAGALSVISFTDQKGPEGSEEFLAPTYETTQNRLAFIMGIQDKINQEKAAYSKQD